MLLRYPIKFLDSYDREDRDLFFGRDSEIESLYEMVFQTDLLLIYGASGTGKTSLIQCGLGNKFASHDWMPISIRRGDNLNDSFERALIMNGGEIAEVEEDLSWLDDDFTGDGDISLVTTQLSPLARQLKAVYLKHFKPIYLIFDQFEELYILGDTAEQETFIDTVKEILKVEQPVKLIISIREEYLGYLYEFERAVPELLRKKLRVEPMNLEKVKTVVKRVGSLPTGNISLQTGEEDELAEQIFEKIRGEEKTLNIQLPYLQVFLDKLYLHISGDEQRRAEATFNLSALQEIGAIDDVLRDFLDEQVLQIARQQRRPAEEVWAVLSPFVTLEGTKEPLSAQHLATRTTDIGVARIETYLQALVRRRILRFRENEELYEIAHDSLAKQINAKRSDEEIARLEVRRLIKSQTALNADAREYFSEKQLDFVTPYLPSMDLSEEEVTYLQSSRKAIVSKNRYYKRVTRAVTVLGIVIIGALSVLTFWALHQQHQAKEALYDLARQQKVNAAQSLLEHANSYYDLKKMDAARRTYDAALESLSDYPDDELYRDIKIKKARIK
jgi:hypothetical protein